MTLPDTPVKKVGPRVLRNPKHVALVLHVLIFLGLAFFAAWDVTLIISDYVNDNTVTLTKRVIPNGSIPFLEHASVDICLNFDKETIFSDVWYNKEARHQISMMNVDAMAYQPASAGFQQLSK